jgi:hypothetical protein
MSREITVGDGVTVKMTHHNNRFSLVTIKTRLWIEANTRRKPNKQFLDSRPKQEAEER